MNTTLIKRMRGLWVALVVVLAVGAAGATTAGAASAPDAGAQISGLTKQQKKAKRKALRKCKKVRNARKRRACIRKVRKKYNRIARRNAARKGKTVVVDVRDDYYTPSLVRLRVNDYIKWDWRYSVSSEGHNVSLMSGPAGTSPFDYESPIFKGPNATFKRQFKKAGNYNLFCTLHAGMTMDVQVKK